MLQHCRREARTSIHDLRNIELVQRGLAGALQELLPAAAQECGAKFELTVTGDPLPFETTVENHLLRIAQESVSNAAHHAAPRKITVRLDYKSDSLALEVRDDGRGFDPAVPAPAGHFGLLGLRERVKKIHANLTLETAPGKGTTIRILVPFVKHP
jgi:signal transduction histidine kinase